MNTTNLATFPRYTTIERQVREDPGVYTPAPLTNTNSDAKLHVSAADHPKHLYRAQRIIGEALNLSGLVLASVHNEGDSRTMQVETALKVIEKKLKKAYNRLDQHDVLHSNLFLAYVELKEKSEREESG